MQIATMIFTASGGLLNVGGRFATGRLRNHHAHAPTTNRATKAPAKMKRSKGGMLTDTLA
jgi:hypothetical protein